MKLQLGKGHGSGAAGMKLSSHCGGHRPFCLDHHVMIQPASPVSCLFLFFTRRRPLLQHKQLLPCYPELLAELAALQEG